jgi:hypothetical protein
MKLMIRVCLMKMPAGEAVLRNMSLDNDQGSLWVLFLFLSMQYVFLHTLVYVFLRFTAGRKKA